MKIDIKKTVILSLLVITGLAFAAVKNNVGSNSVTNKDSNSEKPLVSNVQQTPDLKFKDENGKTVALSSLKGKVVFINFWATWCPPCIQEIPSINELKQSFKGNDKIVFLMVDVDNNVIKSTAFMKKKKYDLSVYGAIGEIPSTYLGNSIPTTIILDKDGSIIVRIEGGRDYTSPEIIKNLNELVKNK